MEERQRPNLESLMVKRTDDDEMYQARSQALKGLMYQLEDENNLIAIKIAETKRRIARKKASIQQMAEAVAAVERGEWEEPERPKKGPTADGMFRFAGGRVISLKDAGLLPSYKSLQTSDPSSQSREGDTTETEMPVEVATNKSDAERRAGAEMSGRGIAGGPTGDADMLVSAGIVIGEGESAKGAPAGGSLQPESDIREPVHEGSGSRAAEPGESSMERQEKRDEGGMEVD